jgi:hypothetical protein
MSIDARQLVSFAVAVLSCLVAVWCTFRKRTQTLKLYRIEFSQGDFAKLAKPEQLFLLRLANIRNDLRHIFCMCVVAERGKEAGSQIEKKIAVHQLLFYLRQIYGTLEEGWKVIHEGWDGQRLHKTLESLLSDDGRNALQTIRRYFSRPNLARTIRDTFAFHYDSDALEPPLARRPSTQVCEIISGMQRGNIFHAFAEDIRSEAMLMTVRTGQEGWSESEIGDSIIKLYEGYQEIDRAFIKFSDEILVGLTKRIGSKVQPFTQTDFTDFREVRPILFVDEESLTKLGQ